MHLSTTTKTSFDKSKNAPNKTFFVVVEFHSSTKHGAQHVILCVVIEKWSQRRESIYFVFKRKRFKTTCLEEKKKWKHRKKKWKQERGGLL